MNCKPIVTYAGDATLFASLESLIINNIPLEPTEWRRSYGRPIKNVYIESAFLPFNKDNLPKSGVRKLLEQPILHIYWTECSDVDVYKSTVREDIECWMKILNQHNIQDWMIVLVETYDLKKSNKLLLRTTVLDKIRSDFAAKNGDRCLSVINPIKSESRSAESWRGLLGRMRLLILSAYNKTLIKFEEVIRDQRERRNEPGWSFCQYFLLQEELAFVLEMLGLFDEALVQYDELDALFTQFVLNSIVGDTPVWLSNFQSPFDNWSSIVLSQNINEAQRNLLKECKASLLEFRGYLFHRQCAMLLLMGKTGEIAQRSLPFLHNCIQELEILEISTQPGAVACWVFLCCLEVLHTCERWSVDLSEHVDGYSLYTANLWAYAAEKLRELGELCGLMPGTEPTSEQLHTVVGLSAGMGDSSPSEKIPTPTDKLKEALSSQEAFKKHYMELAELAMGTFKHIGRIRSARSVGRELASFYMMLQEPQKAAVFLSDALKTYEEEDWRDLVAQTQLELANCYRAMGDSARLSKICAAISCCRVLKVDTRLSHYQEMLQVLENYTSEPVLITPLTDSFRVNKIEIKTDNVIIKGSTVEVELELESLFPLDVYCKRISLSYEQIKDDNSIQSVAENQSDKKLKGKPQNVQLPLKDTHSHCFQTFSSDLMQRLHIIEELDYKQDKSLSSANVIAANPKQFLRRTDSQGKRRKVSTAAKADWNCALEKDSVSLSPGCNSVCVSVKAKECGTYKLGQLSVLLNGSLEFVSNLIKPPNLSFTVTEEPSSVSLNKGEKDLLAGLEQEMVLTISSGSNLIVEGTCIRLRASRNLLMQLKDSSEPLCTEITVPLPEMKPFEVQSMLLNVVAELPPQKDSNTIEHRVNLQVPWASEEKNIILHFQPPFMSTYRLHTAHCRKFIQILITGLNPQMVEQIQPCLSIKGDHDHKLIPLNPAAGQKHIVRSNMKVSYLWELVVEPSEDTNPIKTEFTVKYREIKDAMKLTSEENLRTYNCNFDVVDYKTLYEVKSSVEPMKDNEFCRANTMCHLQLHVQRVNPSNHNSLMYEVLANQTMWAVCGRTAGVISLESVDKQSVTLDVMPLIGGYLPLPSVRLSKYIPADKKMPSTKIQAHQVSPTSHPRLEPFSIGQVYNSSKGEQVHVMAAVTPAMLLSSSIK